MAQSGPPGGLQFSDEQRQCLEEKLGKPNPSSRPSKEKVEAAFKDCGLKWADVNPDQNQSPEAQVDGLIKKYKSAGSKEEKDFTKEAIKSIFYATKSDALKDKIRSFFKENRENSATTPINRDRGLTTAVQ